MSTELELVSWRRSVSELYAAVRAEDDPRLGHALWRRGRDELFRTHPQSPLPPGDPLRTTGLPYWPYDAALRWELPLRPADREESRSVPSSDGTIPLVLVGSVRLPAPLDATIDVWWLHQYGGGLFLPLRDGTAGTSSYGGGRYALDTAKGADLGGRAGADGLGGGGDLGGGADSLVVDLNFLYHPSCRYNHAWQCPLAPAGNTISTPVTAGERM
jgi:uncharacterized protein (DUF1684 family)